MTDNNQLAAGLIFKNMVADGLVPEILEKSVFSTQDILQVDLNLSKEIRDLLTPEIIPLTRKLLVKS